MANRIIEVFFETNMRNGHDGLARILKRKLSKGEYAVFINRNWTALKMLTSEDTLLHLRRPSNKPINPKTIPYLPACVNGSRLQYDRALRVVIEKEYQKAGMH
jgi:hypothetical protein